MRSMLLFLAVLPCFACAMSKPLETLETYQVAHPRFQHVIYIVFENENAAATEADPVFKFYADQGISFSNMLAEVHPSQGNYIAMIAGDNLGVKTDKNVNLKQTHIGDLLEQHGMDWRVYAEDFPGDCFTGKKSGAYARKHVPFMSFLNVSTDPERCKKITDLTAFQLDWENNKLANFNMVIPNLNNDGHDTSLEFAGKWLDKTFSKNLKNPKLMEDTLIIVTFDESESYFGANQIYTAIIAPGLQPGQVISDKHNHYSLLKFIETEWNLGDMGRKDKTAALIKELQPSE
jgi:hypothetical protein